MITTLPLLPVLGLLGVLPNFSLVVGILGVPRGTKPTPIHLACMFWVVRLPSGHPTPILVLIPLFYIICGSLYSHHTPQTLILHTNYV